MLLLDVFYPNRFVVLEQDPDDFALKEDLKVTLRIEYWMNECVGRITSFPSVWVNPFCQLCRVIDGVEVL